MGPVKLKEKNPWGGICGCDARERKKARHRGNQYIKNMSLCNVEKKMVLSYDSFDQHAF